MALAKEINPADIQRDIANDLIKGIVARLHAVFGDSYTFYTEDVKQGLKTPSFAVVSMDWVDTPGMKTRTYGQFPFAIHYLCDTRKPRQEWNSIAQKLRLALDWLDACNTKLRGDFDSPKYDSAQEQGIFYVTYGMHLMDVWQEPDKMESAELTDLPETNGDIHVGGKCDNDSCPIDWR